MLQNPWQAIPLSAYEAHMQSDEVYQLQTLNEIMKEQLSTGEKTVTILGVAGGNGLEHIDPERAEKIHIVDINADYLDACKKRYAHLAAKLEIHCRDLSEEAVLLPESGLLICNLIVEYIGLDAFTRLIERSLARLTIVSCVIQKNNGARFVGASKAAKELAPLDALHRDIEKGRLIEALSQIGLRAVFEKIYPLPGGKEFVRVDFM